MGINKRVGNWLARNKWWIVGAIVVIAGVMYLTDRFGT